MLSEWPWPKLPDTVTHRRLAERPEYREHFDRHYRADSPEILFRQSQTRKPCISLVEKIRQDTGQGCGGAVRWCAYHDEPCVTVGPSPVPNWCSHCGERIDRL